MEFFLPGLLLFFISLTITAWIAPKATPAMAAILSTIFLSYGVYHHYKLFSAEYRQSTWQEGLKIYAPATMLLAVFVVAFYGILSFFASGKVPVPALPAVSLPAPDSITGAFTNSMESIGNSVTNGINSLSSMANNNANSLMNSLGNSLGLNQNQNNKGNKGNKGNVSRSFLETV